jgi:ferritin
MAKETKNDNFVSFVDALTPQPKVITEDFIDFQKLSQICEKASKQEQEIINRMIDMVLSCDRQKKFLSLGEQFAFNTLAKQGIIL